MSATWPSGLPDKFFGELSTSAQDNTIVSQVDSGPPQHRKRFTRALKFLEFEMQLTGTELAIFDAWFDSDLGGGSLSFTWRNPVAGGTATYRFKGGKRPKWRSIAPAAGSPAQAVWRAPFELEILP